MSEAPLYNSRIFNIYLKLVRHKFDHIKPNTLLKKANIEPYKVADCNHWFTQQQLDRFYDTLIRETGDMQIAREAGRFAAAPESSGFIRQNILGFASPASAFKHLKRTMAHLTHSCTFECRQLSSTQVEITVHKVPGTKENAGQCHFRQGMFEAIVTIFNLEMPRIDHSECLSSGGIAAVTSSAGKHLPARHYKKFAIFRRLQLWLRRLPHGFSIRNGPCRWFCLFQ